MDQVLMYDKSLQERLSDYLDILSNSQIKTVENIRQEWSYHLEFAMDPNGWQAVWKIPRITCEKLHIPFPTVVLVYVENIDFEQLAAKIKIIAVQDDISLPEKHIVPLLQIWPTKEQDKSIPLNMESTGNSLDMYRFFYTHIFFSWDYDEDDSYDWLNKHLENRLRLFYDMKNGVIARPTQEHIKSLLSESRKLQSQREALECEIGDYDIDGENSDDERVQTLMDLNVKIIQIKSQVELLENPVTRNVIIKRQCETEVHAKKQAKPQLWIIFDQGEIDECLSFLQNIKVIYPNETVRLAPTLRMVLEWMNENDTIILNKAIHLLQNTSGLQYGGHLKGVHNVEQTILESSNENIMLDFSAPIVTLENITINATFAQCGILVRTGKTVLKNCHLLGDNNSSIHQGIIVLNGSEIEIINCTVSGFGTAIVGNSGSKITIENSKINSVNIGVKIYDKCILKAVDCSFEDCKEYGLCLETTSDAHGKQKIGNFDILEVISDVSAKGINGKDIIKGNVVINQMSKIRPLQDLFSTPPSRLNKNISENEDEMECSEAEITIVEKRTCEDSGDKI